jgi:hypothetical protein
MNRRLANALATAAFVAFVAAPAALTGAQTAQENEAPPRTGQKATKDVQTSCPVHPEIKARTAEKCPKCRMEARKQQGARDKNKDKVQQQPQGETANE